MVCAGKITQSGVMAYDSALAACYNNDCVFLLCLKLFCTKCGHC